MTADLPAAAERLEDPLVGIEGGVGDQPIGGHLRQQRVGADQIMRLSRRQQKSQWLAERVDQGMDFRAQPTAAAADGLILIFFWARRRCADGPGQLCCRSSHIRYRHRRPGAETLCCHTPFLAQRLNRRCVFFQPPNRSGRSRHGIPAR